MLELPRLLLTPWDPRGPSPRSLVDPATGDEVGSVRWREPAASLLGRLLTPPVLEVREAEDEPLLCTLRKLWSWGVVWQVREADGHRVAVVTRREVRNRADRRLALLRDLSDDDGLEMRGQDGMPLAVLRRGGKGDLLTYAAVVEGNPFVKMALLAVALTRHL
jgi:hypothetical protein